MYKLAKWAYKMGVRQERVRIAAHLQNIKSGYDLRYDQNTQIFQDPDTSARRKKRIEFDMAVDQKMRQVIHDLMSPQFVDQKAISLMFPEDEE